MTVDSIFQKQNFLLFLKTGKRFTSVRTIEVSALSLESAIVTAKLNPKDILDVCVLTEEFGWLLIPSIASLEASYAVS